MPLRTEMSPRIQKRTTAPSLLVLRVALCDIEPAIWRRLHIPDVYSLHQLHRVLQLVFGWQDYHLYAYEIGARRFEAPDPEAEGEDATRMSLRSLAFQSGTRFEYTYDFGDEWVHTIEVENVLPGNPDDQNPIPELIAGERAGPHEDSGGPIGYVDRLAAFRDPSHPDYEELRGWAGELYDPDRFDPWQTNQNLMLAAAWGAI